MRKLFRILAVFALILVGGFLMLRYVLFPIVPVDHLYKHIPDSADLVILVDTDELLSLAFSEFLRSPSGGNPFDDDDEDDTDDQLDLKDILRKGLWHGLEVPDQLIIYRNDFGYTPTTVVLPISNHDEFAAFIRDIQDRTSLLEQSPGAWSDSGLSLVLGDDCVRIDLGVMEPSHSLTTESSRWPVSIKEDVTGSILRVFSADTRYANGVGTLFSDSGELRFDWITNDEIPFESAGQSAHSKAWMAIQIGPDSLSRSELLNEPSILSRAIRKAGLDPIALDGVWDGRFEFCVEGISTVQEEVVSYSYNDDFEKIERRELRDRMQADFNASIGLAKPSDSLFYHRSWVKQVDGKEIFVSYPIQEILFSEEVGRMRFKSTSAELRDCIDSPGQVWSLLDFDLAELESDWNQGRDTLDRLSTGIRKTSVMLDPSRKHLTVQLLFSDANRQGLFSLLNAPFIEHFY